MCTYVHCTVVHAHQLGNKDGGEKREREREMVKRKYTVYLRVIHRSERNNPALQKVHLIAFLLTF
jgi:hypothetical protein